jgi:hypothetical protein
MEEHNLDINDFILDEIESIELVGDEDTIDITVDDTHMFFANDIYTHNSSIKADVVEGDQIAGSIKKAQIVHFMVSIAKTLEQKETGKANMAILKSRFGKSGVVFEDIIFDNSTVQIDMSQNSNGKSFYDHDEVKDFNNQDRVNNLLEVLEQRRKEKDN